MSNLRTESQKTDARSPASSWELHPFTKQPSLSTSKVTSCLSTVQNAGQLPPQLPRARPWQFEFVAASTRVRVLHPPLGCCDILSSATTEPLRNTVRPTLNRSSAAVSPRLASGCDPSVNMTTSASFWSTVSKIHRTSADLPKMANQASHQRAFSWWSQLVLCSSACCLSAMGLIRVAPPCSDRQTQVYHGV